MASAASLVEKATSDLLIGPDWAMNLDICDIINGDPGQSRDVVKAVKKRLTNKNAKVQLLALTVLETLIKNCSEIVHQQVAEKDVLHEMTKVVKKKSDMQVRDKVLTLIDSWQEAFGGSRGRYPQYYMAFEELRRLGVEFPDRAPEHNVPIFTPPQSSSTGQSQGYGSPRAGPGYSSPGGEGAMASEFPSMSLTDIEAARSGVEVLSEMLNAINPSDKEAVVDEVIMDLVDQSRTNQRRVMQLVNTTSDEQLLGKGLSLNDDLQQVLAKHDAIASGSPLPRDPTTPTGRRFDSEESEEDSGLYRSSRNRPPAPGPAQSKPVPQLTLPPPPRPQNFTVPSSGKELAIGDLLSGDNYQEGASRPSPTTAPPSQPVPASPQPSPLSSNPFDSEAAFQALPPEPQPSYSQPPQQQQQLQQQPQQQQQYPNTNGLNSPTSAPQLYGYPGYPQQQFQPTQGQGMQNYVVPWATPNLSSPRSSIYGQMPMSPQQQAQLQGGYPSVSAPPWGGGQTTSPPTSQQQQYPQQQQTSQQQMSPQQRAMLYGTTSTNAPPSPLPPPPVRHSQRQQFFQQQQQGSPTSSPGDLVGQTQNLSLQQQSLGGQSLQQAAAQQKQPVKEASAADKLFEDLVDLSNPNSRFKTAGILSRGPSKTGI